MVMIAAPCFAQDTHQVSEPRIIINSSPDIPIAGATWTLTLLIDHPEPNEVEVMAPHFTGPLFLDQVNKVSRFINPSTGQSHISHPDEPIPAPFERWTVMEYRFILNSPGDIGFEIFTIITPQGKAETDPFDLIVQQPQDVVEIKNYRLAWEGSPPGLKTGENAAFSLRIINWNSFTPPPEAELFLPPVPPGHILESVPLTFEEKSGGIALKLRLIPLEEGSFVLEKRQIAHNDAVFEIPALRIPVSATASSRVANKTAAENEILMKQSGFARPFPSLETAVKSRPDLYHKRQKECEAIYAEAQELWKNRRRANALALLRQNERDHPAGAFFAIIRREAEGALSLSGTNDEKRSMLPFFKKKSRAAVLKETTVRQIPDAAGEEIARFREGQPVLLHEKTHSKWLRVMSNDTYETSGWVPEENIIFY